MKANAVSFLAGLLFAVGLALAGMGQPSTVVGFLDVFGSWNPSLALLMIAGIPIVLVAHLFGRGRTPLYAPQYPPAKTEITAPLLAGAAIFGVGWGLAGICPGPGLLALAAGLRNGVLLVTGMIAGMALYNLYEGRKGTRQCDETGAPVPGA